MCGRLACTLGLMSFLLGAVHGCVGDDPARPTGTTDDGGTGLDASQDAPKDGITGVGDGPCIPGCLDANTLRTCSAPDETCRLGCAATTTPHCKELQPSAPVVPGDLKAPNVDDVILGTSTFMNTETGKIDGVRAPNVNPESYEVIAGIGFKLFKGVNVAVFTTKSFTINDTIQVGVLGKAAIAIVAATKMTLRGYLDARGHGPTGVVCDYNASPIPAGPGGVVGGTAAGAPAPGAGGGLGGDIGGGGGGGFGGGGGAGAPSDGVNYLSLGGNAVPFPTTLSGGFGGGASGASGTKGGGGGGGGVQLVAGSEISIGGGTLTGGVNAGGCGGAGGLNANFPGQGGSGGGSGGEILLQTLSVTFASKGGLAANGGAGGAGGGPGLPADLSDQPAQPTPTAATAGQGGAGSAGSTLKGASGAVCSVNPTVCLGGGGGGGAGWIRIETASGTAPTLPSGAFISPSLGTTAVVTAKVTAN